MWASNWISPSRSYPRLALNARSSGWASECSPPIVIGKKSRFRVSRALRPRWRVGLRHVEQRDRRRRGHGRADRPCPRRSRCCVVKNGQTIRKALGPRCAATCLIAPRDRHHQQADVERLLAIPGLDPVRHPRLVGILPRRTPHQLRRPQIGKPCHRHVCPFLPRPAAATASQPLYCGNRDPFAVAFQRFARGEGDGQRLQCVGRSGAVGGVAAANGLGSNRIRLSRDRPGPGSTAGRPRLGERQLVVPTHLDATTTGAEGVLRALLAEHFES